MYSLLVDHAVEARIGMGKATGWEVAEAVDKDLADFAVLLRIHEANSPPVVVFYDPAKDPWVKLAVVTSSPSGILVAPRGTPRRRDQLRATWGLIPSTESTPGGVRL